MSRQFLIPLCLAMGLSTAAIAQSSPDAPRQPPRVVGGGHAGAIGGGPVRENVVLPRAHLGIAMDRIGEALAVHLNINPNDVVLIVNVTEDGPAEKAGLKRFDVVTQVDGRSPVTQQVIREVLRSKEPGDDVTLRVLRGGEVREIVVTLAEPERRAAIGGGRAGVRPPRAERGVPHERRLIPHERWLLEAPPHVREQVRELLEELRRDWREHEPLIEEHLRQLREETKSLRDRFGREWREQWREFKLDEESREELGQWLESAAERTASALERLAEALEGIEIDIDVQAPRVEITREVGGARGMVVFPDPDQPPRRPGGGGGIRISRDDAASPHGEVERRLNRMERRLERIERMMERLAGREGE